LIKYTGEKKMDNARLAAVDVIEDVLYKGAYSNIALSNRLNKSNLNVKDRSLATEIVYGTLKYKYTIDCILENFLKNDLEKKNSYIKNILRISIYQIKYLDKIPEFAVVNEAVKLSKKRSVKLSKLVNGVLRNFLRNKDKLYLKDQDYIKKLCFKYSFDMWMVKLFVHQYGKDIAEDILNGLNSTPKVTVRVNNLKTNFLESWNELKNNGYNLEKAKLCKDAIVINRGSSIEKNVLFNEGMISVQDESAMLPIISMDIEKNMILMDLCSAPGGKACYMAEIMENTGKVVACDIYENKIKLIRKNADRLGLKNIDAYVQDAQNYNPKMREKADRVLIDVPCSGLGIIRKKPEIKWNKNINQISDIISTQKKIMINAAKYVKPGGKLIYSTCTLNKNENEKNVDWFIENNPEFTLEKINFGDIDNIIYHKRGYVIILPNKNMDGFFIAKMIKNR
jgi:16S rRNA (cytosine967-C5)-methyltransferase